MSPNSSRFDAASRAAKIAERSIAIEFKEVKAPPITDDFYAKFQAASGHSSGLSNHFIVDVFPDFIPLVMFCIYHANQHISSLDARSHAKLSLATLTCYYVNLIYAHFLVSDIYIRPTSSPYADEIESQAWSQRYVHFLLNQPLPDFLKPVLSQFVCSSSARRGNIVITPSFAGFHFDYHYGRYLPINAFTTIHDIAAQSNSRSDPFSVLVELLSSPLFTVDRKSYSLGMLTATLVPESGTSQDKFKFVDNKVSQSIQSLFNPVLLRAYQQKQSFASINLKTQNYPNKNFNPYKLLMSICERSVPELTTLFTSISATIVNVIPCSGDLASLYKSLSNVSIFEHGYSRYRLPSWHATILAEKDDYKKKVTGLEPEDFAKLLNFKQQPDQSVLDFETNEFPQCEVDSTHPVKIKNDDLLLVRDKDFPTDSARYVPPPSAFYVYSDGFDLYPRVQIFNFTEEDVVSAWMPTLCGMVIESDELASSTVLHPHPDAAIGVENSTFLTSAIPFRSCKKATAFTISAGIPTYVVVRDQPSQQYAPAFSHLRSPTRMILPYLVKQSVYTTFSRIYYGLSPMKGVTFPEAVQTALGFLIKDNPNSKHSPDTHEPPNSPYNRLLLWSPYVYVSRSYRYDYDANDTSESNSQLSYLFFLTNFRTLFGHDVTLTEVSNAYEAMPIY